MIDPQWFKDVAERIERVEDLERENRRLLKVEDAVRQLLGNLQFVGKGREQADVDRSRRELEDLLLDR